MTALPLILTTHVDCEPTLDVLDLAFARLGGFLDTQAATLEALGEALSLQRVGHSLGALHLLHRGGRDTDPQVIETAIGHLEDLRDELLAVPNNSSVVMPQALEGVISNKEVDAAVRFMGARVDDQICMLRCALERD